MRISIEGYVTPQMEIIDLSGENVITTSCNGQTVDTCNFGYCSGHTFCDEDDV